MSAAARALAKLVKELNQKKVDLTSFNPPIPRNRPQLAKTNYGNTPPLYKRGQQLLLRDAGLGKFPATKASAKALNEEGRTAAKALARLSTSIKKSNKQSVSDVDVVARFIAKADNKVQGQVLSQVQEKMNPAAFALLLERMQAVQGRSASRVLDRVQKGQGGKNISRARQKEFDIQGPQMEGQDETSFVKSYLEQKVDRDTRQVVDKQIFEDDFFFVDPARSKARAMEADILLDDVVGTPTTYDPIREASIGEAVQLPQGTKEAVLGSYGAPTGRRSKKIARDLAADLPLGSKLRDVKESAQIPAAMKLGAELPQSFAKQRGEFPLTDFMTGQASVAGSPMPNPLEFLSQAQLRSVLREIGGR